jgi:2-oxoisovalerate dehydrogenase E1 component alpha subunit
VKIVIEILIYECFFLNRVGHHSTSDDSSAYRPIDEINSFDKKYNPIIRFRNYLYKQGCWNEEKDDKWKEKSQRMV